MRNSLPLLAHFILIAAISIPKENCTLVLSPSFSYRNTTDNSTSTDISINYQRVENNVVEYLEDKVLDLQDELESFVQHLQSFILETVFADEEFSFEASKIEKHLWDITAEAKQIVTNIDIERMLCFAHTMFQIMVETAENLKHYDLLGTMDQYLLSCMCELNVRLLAFFDATGFPDFSMEGFSENVRRLCFLMNLWSQEFEGLSHVPVGIRRVFDIQKFKANQKLSILTILEIYSES